MKTTSSKRSVWSLAIVVALFFAISGCNKGNPQIPANEARMEPPPGENVVKGGNHQPKPNQDGTLDLTGGVKDRDLPDKK